MKYQKAEPSLPGLFLSRGLPSSAIGLWGFDRRMKGVTDGNSRGSSWLNLDSRTLYFLLEHGILTGRLERLVWLVIPLIFMFLWFYTSKMFLIWYDGINYFFFILWWFLKETIVTKGRKYWSLLWFNLNFTKKQTYIKKFLKFSIPSPYNSIFTEMEIKDWCHQRIS